MGVLVATAILSLLAVRRDPSLRGMSPEVHAEEEADGVLGEALEHLPPEHEQDR